MNLNYLKFRVDRSKYILVFILVRKAKNEAHLSIV